MLAYVLQRLASVTAILIVMSILVFGVVNMLPGNAAIIMLGSYSTPEALAALEAKLGLNDPLLVQYWRWATDALQGDLGNSLVMERPIAPVLWDALQRSAILAIAAIVCVAVIGILLGVIAALYEGRFTDHAVSLFGYLGMAIPEFFWAIVLIILFSSYLGWLPTVGYEPLSTGLWPFLSHLILPVITLTLTLIAHIARLTRSSMLDVLQSSYIRAARARGLPERVVVMNHALRNGLLPTITVLAQDFGWLIGGIVVIESVFAYPGLGRLLIFSIERHDLPFVQAIVLVVTATFCLANLGADLLYAALNPKIRYGASAR